MVGRWVATVNALKEGTRIDFSLATEESLLRNVTRRYRIYAVKEYTVGIEEKV